MFWNAFSRRLVWVAILLVLATLLATDILLTKTYASGSFSISQIHLVVLGVAFFMISIAFGAGIWLSRTIDEPLQEMLKVTQRLSHEEYGSRVKHFSFAPLSPFRDAINQLAQNVELKIQDLFRDKAQLASILSNMVEAVAAVDAQGRIVAINPALSKLFDVEAEIVSGKVFLEVLRHTQLNELLSSVLKDHKSRVDEAKTMSPDEHIFDAHAVPLMEGEACVGALMVLHDITKIRKLEQIRRDFVANVSHELRTPLASIKGFAETLRCGALEDKENRLEFVKAIEDHTDRMTRLVDDLLDLAAIESGQRLPVREQLPLIKMIKEVVNGLKPLAASKKIAIELPPNGLPLIRGDKIQLKQVFSNLLDNAIKFNKENGVIKISTSIEPPFLRISVEDTGIGIPSQDIPRIFERFYRVDKARSREMGGTGLGLAIVKHIIELHGGTIGIESSVGKGSIFHVRLPIEV